MQFTVILDATVKSEDMNMTKMKRWKQLSLVVILLSLLVACGQKGDLYLPESKQLTSWIEL